MEEEKEYVIGVFQNIDDMIKIHANSLKEAKLKVIDMIDKGEVDVYEDAEVHVEHVEALEDKPE